MHKLHGVDPKSIAASAPYVVLSVDELSPMTLSQATMTSSDTAILGKLCGSCMHCIFNFRAL